MALVPPTSSQVLALRDQREISIYEAKRVLLYQAVADAIDSAQNMDDIKEILNTIINNWHMK